MKKVITYGTFDFFHYGHEALLKRAKQLGDYLIVGITSDNFDRSRGKLNVVETLEERIQNVKNSNLADEIIVEDYHGQKIQDIKKYDIDIFTVGSDWEGHFDYLNEYCNVIYLERTKNISSTQLRTEAYTNILNIGIVGVYPVSDKFMHEVKFVSGTNVNSVYSKNLNKLHNFAKKYNLNFFTDNYEIFLKEVDIVFICEFHDFHYELVKIALENKKHVIVESPLILNKNNLMELYSIADKYNLVLMDAIKTAYSPSFNKLVEISKSGIIGNIKDVDICFTSIMQGYNKDPSINENWGSLVEFGAYVLLPAVKLFGKPKDYKFYSFVQNGIDQFTRIMLFYENSIVNCKMGIGVKSEGQIIMSGTDGYIVVEAPWWRTEKFEIKYEDINLNKKYYYQFSEYGLRYELAELIKMINNDISENHMLTRNDSIIICEIMESYVKSNKDIFLFHDTL